MSSRLSGSGPKPLPAMPPSATPGSSSSSSSKPQVQITDLSQPLTMSPSSRRYSGQPVPRPAPIPIPEPVPPPPPVESSSSGEGPSSSDSTNSALASVSAELIQHITIGTAPNTTSRSPTSPKETNNLLGESSSGVATPRSGTIPRIASLPSQQRPRSAVDSPYGTTPVPNIHGNNRPHSSADQWGVRPSSVHSLSGDNVHQVPQHTAGGNGQHSRSHSPSADSMLRPSNTAMPRSRSSNFINTPSPLNPNALPIPRRPGSSSSRPASMVLYRLTGIENDFNPQMASLSPPVTTTSRRASRFSTLSSANSTYSVFSDSKYPAPAREDGTLTPPPSGAFEPYEYDPSWDQDAPDDEEDALHAPDPPGTKERIGAFNFRGFFNIIVVFGILAGLIIIFAIYPIVLANYSPKANFFSGTGQADPTNDGDGTPSTSTSRTASDLIDPDTPESAKAWTGLDGTSYKLVFSDEFKKDDRTFKAGDDPFWEAVNLYDRKNQDLNYYDSEHVTTKDGSLVITLEQKSSHTRDYTSGMLQSWNKMCFTGGYIEVAVSLPGTAQTIGFTPQVYTMGNLARSGYGATEDGVLPYSYNTCDYTVGAQADGSSLTGQRLSACTCAGERTDGNHPGPAGIGGNPSRGRGAPQVDILGNLNDQGRGGIISQSLRVAPLSQGRLVTGGATVMSGDTELNTYTGSDSQQVISALTNVPTTAYTAGQFASFGYEHVVSGGVDTAGSLHWVKDGVTQTFQVDGTALATDGAIGQRLIPNEPMYVVLSLALSQAVGAVAPASLTFPAKLLVDYVRVYQIEGQESVTCNPTGFPTKDYIEKHAEAYGDPTHLSWASAGYTNPLNLIAGDC